jgi:hypothetical protein
LYFGGNISVIAWIHRRQSQKIAAVLVPLWGFEKGIPQNANL